MRCNRVGARAYGWFAAIIFLLLQSKASLRWQTNLHLREITYRGAILLKRSPSSDGSPAQPYSFVPNEGRHFEFKFLQLLNNQSPFFSKVIACFNLTNQKRVFVFFSC